MIGLDITALDINDMRRILALLAAEADEVAAPALRRAIVDLTVHAKSIAHVKTGVLRASLHPEGPFQVGTGTLEAVVSPEPAFYAAQEVARGGEHDYASRTLIEARDVIDKLIAELEADVTAHVRGK